MTANRIRELAFDLVNSTELWSSLDETDTDDNLRIMKLGYTSGVIELADAICKEMTEDAVHDAVEKAMGGGTR